MKTVTILKRARKLLEKPERWGQGWVAMSNKGEWVDATSKKAVCFCVYGACCRVASVDDFGERAGDPVFEATELLDKATMAVTRGEIKSAPAYNDAPRRTHPQILKLFDKAIELASIS